MNWKEFVAGYLHFTRRDRIAVLVLVTLIFLVFFLPAFFPANNSRKLSAEDTAWAAALQKLETRDNQYDSGRRATYFADENPSGYQYDRPKGGAARGELFVFDPNTLTTQGWQRLGLRDKTIGIIQNYLAKGGRFRKPEDLQRIYGLQPGEYERIAPYISIAANTSTTPAYHSEIRPAATTASRYSPIDIGTADTTAFIALPGIGSKLAARIVNFREKLGGFYSVSQVAETYGLPDSTFQKIRPYLQLQNPAVKKININTATVEELKAHPYIRYSIANPIVAYRKEHGPFPKTETLKKIAAVTEDVYSKIAPYLVIE